MKKLIFFLLLCASASAQLWQSQIDPSRASTEWQRAGVTTMVGLVTTTQPVPSVTTLCPNVTGLPYDGSNNLLPAGVAAGKNPVQIDTPANSGATMNGSGVVTLKTLSAPPFVAGDKIVVVGVVSIADAPLTYYSGSFTVTSVTSNTIVYQGTNPGTPVTGGNGWVGLEGDVANINAAITGCTGATEAAPKYVSLSANRFFPSSTIKMQTSGVVLRGSGANGDPTPTWINDAGTGINVAGSNSVFAISAPGSIWANTSTQVRVRGYSDYATGYQTCDGGTSYWASALLGFYGGSNGAPGTLSGTTLSGGTFLKGATGAWTCSIRNLVIGELFIIDENNEELLLGFRALTGCNESGTTVTCTLDNSDGFYKTDDGSHALGMQVAVGGVDDNSAGANAGTTNLVSGACSYPAGKIAQNCYITGYFVAKTSLTAANSTSISYTVASSGLATGYRGHIIADDGDFHFVNVMDVGTPPKLDAAPYTLYTGTGADASNGRMSDPSISSAGSCPNSSTCYVRNHYQVLRVSDVCDSTSPTPKCLSASQTPSVAPYRVMFADSALVNSDYHANRRPGAFWSTPPVAMAGVENLAIDSTSWAGQSSSNFVIAGAYNVWIKGVASIWSGSRNHVWAQTYSPHITIANSYFYGSKHSAQGQYGLETFNWSDSGLAFNNTFDTMIAAIAAGPQTNWVFAYNYFNNLVATNGSSNMGQNSSGHDTGVYLDLWEGNVTTSIWEDFFHGRVGLVTYNANWITGCQTNGANNPPIANSCGSNFSIAEDVYEFNRANNSLFNVIGATPNGASQPNQTTYLMGTPVSTYPCTNSGKTSIMVLGGNGNGCDFYALPPYPVGSQSGIPLDANVYTSRYGFANYIACAAGSSCDTYLTGKGGNPLVDTGEIPNTLPGYPQASCTGCTSGRPASTTGPNSMWWSSGTYSTPLVSHYAVTQWPPIGSFVTGTMGPGNHVSTIPAVATYQHAIALGGTNGSPILFPALTAYTPASSPRNLEVDCLPGIANGTVTDTGTLSMTCVAGVLSPATCGSGWSAVGTTGCTIQKTDGFTDTLTATATTGSFIGWSGACGGTGTCGITVNGADITVGAIFSIKPTVTLSCPSGCSVNFGGQLAVSIATTNVANQAGSYWNLTDPLGILVGNCTYGTGCSLSSATLTLTPLVYGTYTLVAGSGGLTSDASTQLIQVQPVSYGNISGTAFH